MKTNRKTSVLVKTKENICFFFVCVQCTHNCTWTWTYCDRCSAWKEKHKYDLLERKLFFFFFLLALSHANQYECKRIRWYMYIIWSSGYYQCMLLLLLFTLKNKYSGDERKIKRKTHRIFIEIEENRLILSF